MAKPAGTPWHYDAVGMAIAQGARLLAALIVAGTVLFGISLFVADRQLTPPFDEAELGPIEIPSAAPMADALLLSTSNAPGNYEIYAQPLAGGGPERLTNDPAWDSFRPRLSPDRRTVMFYRSPAGVADTDPSQAALWMIAADGTDPVEVLPLRAHGWTSQAHAEWSPMGDQLVMTGGRPQGSEIWITTVDGRAARNLMTDQHDARDPSWSPDATRVLYVACPEESCSDPDREVFAARVTGDDPPIQITNDGFLDQQPQFSPDGSHIVMSSQVVLPDDEGRGSVWDIRVVPTNRSTGPQRLVGDASVSAAPTWLNDRTVIFHRYDPATGSADIYQAQIFSGEVSGLILSPANDLYPAS